MRVMKPRRFPSVLAVVAGVMCCSFTTLAYDLTVQKLVAHGTPGSAAGAHLGGALGGSSTGLAVTAKWIVAGAPSANSGAGLVQVFNAATGAWIRELTAPPSAIPSTNFGSSCAIDGDTLVIGARSSLASGRVFLFNLATGKLIAEGHPPVSPAGNDQFGQAVAIWGSHVFVSASSADNDRGEVLVFDRTTSAYVATLQPASLQPSSFFGVSMAVAGNLLVIGASGVDAAKGMVFVYDATTLELITKVRPVATVAGMNIGSNVGVWQTQVVMCTSLSGNSPSPVFVVDLLNGTERSFDIEPSGLTIPTLSVDSGMAIASVQGGPAHVYDLNRNSLQELFVVAPQDAQPNFAQTVAICNGAAVIAAPDDTNVATHAGALMLVRGITRPLPMTRVTARGDYAPSATDCSFNTLSDVSVNPAGDFAFTSTLSGKGSNGGKDSGAFSTSSGSSLLGLVCKSRQGFVPSLFALGSMSRALYANTYRQLVRMTVTGTTVTTSSNEALYGYDGSTLSSILRKGSPISGAGSAVLASFPQVVQPMNLDEFAAAVTYRTGVAGVTSTSDSGVCVTNFPFASTTVIQEANLAGGTTDNHGQFAPRVAAPFARVVYSSALSGDPKQNAGLFQKAFGQAEVLVARKADQATGAGAPLSAFIGETGDSDETVLYCATLGAPSPVAGNQGLWTRTIGGQTALVFRKGDPVPGLPGVKISKFINYWQVKAQTLALVQLSGTGVNASNDQALLLHQTASPFAGVTAVLMREGDAAPGCSPATIGTISRIEVEPSSGHYLVLATLAGAPSGANLALFRGFSALPAIGSSDQTLRRPQLCLRKGELFDNQPSKLKSMTLPSNNRTPSGAGGVGLGTCMQQPASPATPAPMVIAIDYDNGVHQIVKGIP